MLVSGFCVNVCILHCVMILCTFMYVCSQLLFQDLPAGKEKLRILHETDYSFINSLTN